MKNFKMNKRLLTLLLAGTITLTTTACSMKKDTPVKTDVVTPVESEIVVNEQFPIEGVVTVTENIIDLPEETTLDTQEAIVVSEPISDVMETYAYDGFILNNCHAKAATLHKSNVRKGPGTDYEIVDSLYRGAIVEVLGKTSDGWCLISFNGQEYFTIESNLTMLNYLYDGMTMHDIVPNLTIGIQPTTELNVREEAKKDSKKLGLISGSRTYKVIDHLDNGWYEIEYHGRTAYVSGDYCKEVYMLGGRFYQYVYATHDCYLYDENGVPKDVLEKYEGGTVYNENDEYYLVWLGDRYGYMRREDVKIAPGRVIDVDMSLQEVTVIDGSDVLFVGDTITGKDSTPTDKGVYTLGAETGPTVLRGPGYESPVDNFAQVNGGEGFHPYGKASDYGDVDFYHLHGSHGCYRLNPAYYEDFFGATKKGDTVVTHK